MSDHGSLQEVPIRLIGLGDLHGRVPSFVSLPERPTKALLQQELLCYGHRCTVEIASNHTLAVCFPESWPYEDDRLLILFTDMLNHFPDDQSAFLTLTEQVDLSEVDMMALLHRFGYEKAVVCGSTYFNESFLEITFQQAGGTLAVEKQLSKTQKPWPALPKGDRTKNRPMWRHCDETSSPDCFLDLGLSQKDLEAFFQGGNDYLCRITEGLSLPQVTRDAIQALHQHCMFDRLIVYADGSSQSRHKHVSPALNEEIDVPDAWCFVVLGETLVDSNQPEYTLVGWHAHQVRYEATQFAQCVQPLGLYCLWQRWRQQQWIVAIGQRALVRYDEHVSQNHLHESCHVSALWMVGSQSIDEKSDIGDIDRSAARQAYVGSMLLKPVVERILRLQID